MNAADSAERSNAESERLAELLLGNDARAIAAEPALAGAVQVMSLASRYFEAAAERSGEVHGVEPAMAEFREMLAGAIGRGEPVTLRSEYQLQIAQPGQELGRDLTRTEGLER